MQVRFLFSPDDVIRYQRFAARHLPWGQRLQLPVYQSLLAALLFWIGAAVFFLVFASSLPIQLRFVMFGGATIFGGIVLLMGTLLRLQSGYWAI